MFGMEKLVQRHPFLMRNIDFGNPERFPPLDKLNSILDLGGSRIRELRICTWKFPFPPFGSGGDMKEDVKIAIRKVVKTVENITLVGHIPQGRQTFFPQVDIPWIFALLKTECTSLRVHIRIETCPCAMNWIQDCYLLACRLQYGPILSISSAICQDLTTSPLKCESCLAPMKWGRCCPLCERQRCNHCSFQWGWSAEFQQERSCKCRFCLDRVTNHVTTLTPPLWTCTTHCDYCHFFKK